MEEIKQNQPSGNFSNNLNEANEVSEKHFSFKGLVVTIIGLSILIFVLIFVYRSASERRDEAEIRAGIEEERTPVEVTEEETAEIHTGRYSLDDGHTVTPEEEAEIKSGQNLEN